MKKKSEPWVVTFHAELVGCISCTEYFRGDRKECLRIARAFGGYGEDDRRRNVNPWRVTIGRAADWDDFLADLEN